ncbi:MAG: hypothetical protein ACT4P1_12955 [Sporichthyaceae bacterium]
MVYRSATVRRRPVALAVGAAVMASPFAFVGVAHADPGSLKIHAPDEGFGDMNNNPKPGCSFRVFAFGVDADEEFQITFEPQGGPPAGSPTTATDTFMATEGFNKKGTQGDGRSRLFNPDPANPEIEDGLYKATSTSLDDPDDNGKTKVFRVNCPDGTDPTPPGEEEPPPGSEDPDEEDPGEVGGVDRDDDDKDEKGKDRDKDNKDRDRDDRDRDDGPPALGGVRTGGGALQADTAGTAAALLPMLLLAGAATASVTYRRRRA